MYTSLCLPFLSSHLVFYISQVCWVLWNKAVPFCTHLNNAFLAQESLVTRGDFSACSYVPNMISNSALTSCTLGFSNERAETLCWNQLNLKSRSVWVFCFPQNQLRMKHCNYLYFLGKPEAEEETVFYYSFYWKSYISGIVCVNTCEISHRHQD